MARICTFLLLILLSCDNQADKNEKFYIHIDGRDTARLRLVTFENRFYGEWTHSKGGVAPVVGEINGDIVGDTLIGDNHYRPYRWREKKRVPIALLKQGDNYIEGDGQRIEFMGVSTYIEQTISFDKPKKTYKPVN